MPPKARTPVRKRIVLPEDDDALIRQSTVLEMYPVSKTSWRDGVREGRYPRPVRLGPRTVAWRAGDIRKLLASVGTDEAQRR